MADVTAAERASGVRERGQLVLTTAVVLATLFLVMAVVLNSVIFTENFATRGDSMPDARDASQFKSAAVTELERSLWETNADGGSYAELRAEFEATVSTWSDLTASHAAVNDRTASLDVVAVTNGTQLTQTNESRKLTNRSGAANWELVNGSDGLRAFTLTLDESSLAVPSNESSGDALRNEGVFGVDIADSSGASWTVFVYSEGEDVNLRVEAPDGTLGPGCTATPDSDGWVTIGLTTGAINGSACPALDFFDELSTPADVRFARADSAAGTWRLIVSSPVSVVDDDDLGAEPTATPALYDASVELRYETSAVEYWSTHTVVPEGGDG